MSSEKEFQEEFRPIRVEHFGFGIIASGIIMIVMWSLYAKESNKDLEKRLKEKVCEHYNAGPYDKDGKLDWQDTTVGRRCLFKIYDLHQRSQDLYEGESDFDIKPVGICKGLEKEYENFEQFSKDYDEPDYNPKQMCNDEKIETLKKKKFRLL